MFCMNCGQQFPDDKPRRFCPSCGKPLAGGQPAPAAPAAPDYNNISLFGDAPASQAEPAAPAQGFTVPPVMPVQETPPAPVYDAPAPAAPDYNNISLFGDAPASQAEPAAPAAPSAPDYNGFSLFGDAPAAQSDPFAAPTQDFTPAPEEPAAPEYEAPQQYAPSAPEAPAAPSAPDYNGISLFGDAPAAQSDPFAAPAQDFKPAPEEPAAPEYEAPQQYAPPAPEYEAPQQYAPPAPDYGAQQYAAPAPDYGAQQYAPPTYSEPPAFPTKEKQSDSRGKDIAFKVIIILLIVAMLAGVGFGIWYAIDRKNGEEGSKRANRAHAAAGIEVCLED